MTTTLIFTTSRAAGNFARILRALSKLNLKPYNGRIDKSGDPQFDSIQMYLNGGQIVEPNMIGQLRDMVPSIINVKVETDEPVQIVAPIARVPEKVIVEETVNVPLQDTNEVVNDVPRFDAEWVETEVRRLTQVYPEGISDALWNLEAALEASQRNSVLIQLGTRLGKYAATKRGDSKKPTALNDTVRKSLALQQAQFGRLSPVIAGLGARKRKKSRASKQKKMDVLVAEMGRFLTVSADKNRLSVQNCPHCDASHALESADCHFISAFIHSFIATLWGGKKLSVTQSASCSTGSPNCVFVISGIRI